MLDLNGFKKVNDVFGHPIGDALLKEVSLRLMAVVRQTGDHVARLGGDEFAIVAMHLRGPEDAAEIASRAIAALTVPIEIDGVEHNVGTGVGIALFPRDGNTTEEVIRRADVALYKSKTHPYSCLMFFEEEMDARNRERVEIERELRRAVPAGEIQPYYQPTFDLKTGKIRGFESLARWMHPKLGEIAPNRFIPIAESCGLIRELSDHLLRTSCLDALRWPADTTLAFNVSAVQLRDTTFGLRVLGILGETGLAPCRLELEISESMLVRDLKSVEEAFEDLRKAGVRIVLDDFGTGYSSLYHLRTFKVDRIKIDRGFVERMTEETESAGIVQALLGLGHGLGVEVTAEGIENAAQREALTQVGCDFGQGFVFGQALSAVDAEALSRGKMPDAPAALRA